MSDKPSQVRHVREYLPRVVSPKPSEIRAAVKGVEGFNAKLAVLITRGVGTMACAYLFAVVALIGVVGRRRGDHRVDRSDLPAARPAEHHHGRSDCAGDGV